MSADVPTTIVAVCPAGELGPGEARVVDIEPPIAVFNAAGVFYAIDDTCSHAKASLADGDLDGCYVECPFHASQFDLRTGEPNGLPATAPVATHTVEIRSGVLTVIVGVPPR